MSNPRGVVMVVQNFFPSIGGAERQALELSRQLLTQKGIPVTVLTQGVSGRPSSEKIQGVPVKRLGGGSILFLISSFLWLLLHRDEYDVIHAHLASSHAVGAALAGKLLGKKVVVKISGSKVVGEIPVSRRSIIGRFKLQALAELKPTLVLVSPAQREDLRGASLENLPTELIPNGVDINLFKPLAPEVRASLRGVLGWEGLIFLFVGRFDPDKLPLNIFENFLSAWSRAQDKAHPATFILVGGGQLEAEYRNRIERFQLQRSVQLLPKRDDVRNLYQAADWFVLPSITEGLSNAMLEALACELPVVGSRVEGIREVVKEGENGLLFDPFAQDDIEAALRKALDSKTDLAKWGKAARQTAEQYSIETSVEAYLKLYRKDR